MKLKDNLKLNCRSACGLLLFVLSVILFFCLRTSVFARVYTLLEAQILTFPLMLIAFVLIFRNKISLLLLGSVTILYSAGALRAYSLLPIAENSILLARFEGDEFESATRILRKKVNEYLADDQDLSVDRYFESFNSTEDSQLFLKTNPKVYALVWSRKNARQEQLLYLSQRQQVPQSLIDIANESWLALRQDLSPIKNLKWFSIVPEVSLPAVPFEAVPAFIAELIYGIRYSSEQHLITASGTQSHWPFADHLVYARFKLADLYFKEFISNSDLQTGFLNCSLRAIRQASRLLEPRQMSSGLGKAVKYNYLMLQLVDALLNNEIKDLKLIKQEFRKLYKNKISQPNRKKVVKKLKEYKKEYIYGNKPLMLDYQASVAFEARRAVSLISQHIKKVSTSE